MTHPRVPPLLAPLAAATPRPRGGAVAISRLSTMASLTSRTMTVRATRPNARVTLFFPSLASSPRSSARRARRRPEARRRASTMDECRTPTARVRARDGAIRRVARWMRSPPRWRRRRTTRCEFRFFESRRRRRRRRPSRWWRGTEEDDGGRVALAVGGGERGVGRERGGAREDEARGMRKWWTREEETRARRTRDEDGCAR